MSHSYTERELTERVPLCTPAGKLNSNSIGWSRKPVISGNLSGNFLRKKKWNYWCMMSDEILFSVTVSHLDYAMVCFVYFLEYETKDFFEKTVVIPFSYNRKMPEDVQNSITFNHRHMNIELLWLEQKYLINVHIPDFRGKPLHANLTIDFPADLDSLSVVIPWSTTEFQLTTKAHCLPVGGSVSIGTQSYSFNKNDHFAILDYGRGVWPRKSVWNWGMASGRQGEMIIGLNFGGKWTDGTGSNENALLLNGHLIKINEDVNFIYDRNDFMKPWTIRSLVTNQIDLQFTPFFERVAQTNAFIITSEVHQMVGHYNGVIELPDGRSIEIRQMLGCIEEHRAKW